MTASASPCSPRLAAGAEVIGRPSPLEGIGGALRNAFAVPRTEFVPAEMKRLLDRLR